MNETFAIADGVAVLDVSGALPVHETKRYRSRRPIVIERVYVHHSGSRGEAGIAGAENCADYTIHAREWPGIPYHYWIPEEGLYDDCGRLVVLRTQPHETISYHTGGLNEFGLGVALQGNKTKRPVTDEQNQALDALLAWMLSAESQLALDPVRPIGWHSIAHVFGGRSKPSCPGKHTEAWLREWLFARGLAIPGEERVS